MHDMPPPGSWHATVHKYIMLQNSEKAEEVHFIKSKFKTGAKRHAALMTLFHKNKTFSLKVHTDSKFITLRTSIFKSVCLACSLG